MNKLRTISMSVIETDHKLDIPNPPEKEMNPQLRNAIYLLSDTDRTLIQEHFIDQRTMEEIGNIHGFSKETARNKLKKAIARLRNLYPMGV